MKRLFLIVVLWWTVLILADCFIHRNNKQTDKNFPVGGQQEIYKNSTETIYLTPNHSYLIMQSMKSVYYINSPIIDFDCYIFCEPKDLRATLESMVQEKVGVGCSDFVSQILFTVLQSYPTANNASFNAGLTKEMSV